MSLRAAQARSTRRRLAMAVAVSLLVAACGSATTTPMGEPRNGGGQMDMRAPDMMHGRGPGEQGMPGVGGEDPAGGEGHAGDAASPYPDATTVRVTAREFGFDPSTIEIEAATPTNITVENTGSAFHDFTVPELDFMVDVEAGQTATGGITVDEPGEYEVVCTVPGHEAAGMTATLVVR